MANVVDEVSGCGYANVEREREARETEEPEARDDGGLYRLSPSRYRRGR